MPIGKYYGGHGEKVMKDMTKQYGKKKAKKVFYATSNKMKKSMEGSGPMAPAEMKAGYRVVEHADYMAEMMKQRMRKKHEMMAKEMPKKGKH